MREYCDVKWNITAVVGYELRYLGVHVVRTSRLKISLDKPRRSFYRAGSSVYGKIEHMSLRKKFMKLRYSCLIVNVFLYCFMDLKPARSVSQIGARLTSHLIDFS